MFDIGWSEMAIILVVALIVIGPRDLPRVARTVGQWVRKGRALAREFQTSLEDMAREADLDDVKRDIEKAGRTDLKRSVEKTIDPEGDLGRAFDPTDGGSRKSKSAKSAKAAGGEAKSEGAAGTPADDQATGGGGESAPRTGGAETPEREKVPAETT